MAETETQIDVPNILFDGKCRLKEIEPEILTKLTPERRDRYEQVRAAAAIAEADELCLVADQKAERQSEKDFANARHRLLKARPVPDRIDELRKSIAAYQRR
jgi:hypothetical protein